MFYQIDGEVKEISFEQLDSDKPAVGTVSADEFREIGKKLGFSKAAINRCAVESNLFRTEVEIHQHYTYTQIKIASHDESDDCFSLFIKENLLLVVIICDTDGSVSRNLKASLFKISADKLSIARALCLFMESFISGDNQNVELIRNEITAMEESVIRGDMGSDFNVQLLEIKKKLLKLHNYYEQILDVAEAIEDNENDIFESSQLIYASNLIKKVDRLIENIDSLRNSSDHLQDAYSAALDMKLNNTMKVFTVITTIFFPLTIIVGWYGMNFTRMPELAWKYGYLYVIGLSVITVIGLIFIGKKRKWF